MLEQIVIKGFQSHRRTIINLSRGVNIFNGISDKGKTAIIRAIRFVVYNKPSGDEFRSWSGIDTSVTLTFTDGNTIKRTKTNTENSYTINDDKPLKAFGQGVPEEVTKILNLEEVNIQMQMDSPFLLSDTSGEVATHFNRIAGISVIDKSISKAKSAVAKTKQSIEHREADLKEKQEQLLAYKDLDTVEKELKYLSKIEKEKVKLKGEIGILSVGNNRLKNIDRLLFDMDEYLVLEKPVKNIIEKAKLFQAKKKEQAMLDRTMLRLGILELQIEQTNQLTKLEQPVNNLLNKVQYKRQFQAEIKALNVIVGKCTTLTNKGQETQEKLVELVDRLPNVCPICNGTGKLK
jgi:exonuclease SbcC